MAALGVAARDRYATVETTPILLGAHHGYRGPVAFLSRYKSAYE